MMEFNEEQLQKQVKGKEKQMLDPALLEQEKKAVEERHKKEEEKWKQFEDKEKARLQCKVTELEKQRERECETKS